MNEVNAAEQVEILDDGVHLGWADLVEGQWSFPPTGLSVGHHQLTARYKGFLSPAWQLRVVEPVDLEDFKDVPVGWVKRLSRTFYNATVTNRGNVAEGATGIAEPGGAGLALGRSLQMYTARNSNPAFCWSFVLNIEFKRVYSQITLTHMTDAMGSSPGTLSVNVLNSSGAVLGTHSFSKKPGTPIERLILGTPEAANIKSLSFSGSPSSVANTGLWTWIGEMEMRP